MVRDSVSLGQGQGLRESQGLPGGSRTRQGGQGLSQGQGLNGGPRTVTGSRTQWKAKDCHRVKDSMEGQGLTVGQGLDSGSRIAGEGLIRRPRL